MNIEEVDLLETIRTIGRASTTSTWPTTTGWHVAWGRSTGRPSSARSKEINYDGALTVEFVAPVDRTPANRYPDAVETNPVDISPEELQFIIDHGSSLLSESFYSMLVEKCATTLLP